MSWNRKWDKFESSPMEIHLRFKGTPAQFRVVAAMVARRWTRVGHVSRIFLGERARGENPNYAVIELHADPVKYVTFKPTEVVAHLLPNGESELTLVEEDKYWPPVKPTWKILYDELIKQGWVADPTKPSVAEGEETERGPGRRELDRGELIYRLAKAQEAEEIKAREPDKRWKEIAKAIGWRLGLTASGVKLLEYARDRLKRAQKEGDRELLDEVKKYRKEKKIIR